MTNTLSPPSELGLGSPLPASLPVSGNGRRRRSWLIGSAVATLGTLFLIGYVPRQARQAALAEQTARAVAELPRVITVRPSPARAERLLELPGSIEPLETAKVHSRASGFVTAWLADMGDRVEAGQLLARLDTPELDRELEQARATLARANASILQADATSEYSISTHRRYAALAPEGLISAQELAEHAARAHVDAANVQVARAERNARAAELQRLQQLQRFGRIVAPFAGTVSARHVERGALINAGSGGPLFEIVETDPVRVYVPVPQSLVGSVEKGQAVTLSVSEYPGTKFSGTLTRASGTLEPGSRTMRVEVRVPNPDGRLMPGMYASVSLNVKREQRSFLLPSTALVPVPLGMAVASVDSEGRVRFIPVEIERDFGAEVEIRYGLTGAEAIITAPGPRIEEGARVSTLKATST